MPPSIFMGQKVFSFLVYLASVYPSNLCSGLPSSCQPSLTSLAGSDPPRQVLVQLLTFLSLSQFQVHLCLHDYLISLCSSLTQRPHKAEDSLQLSIVSSVPSIVFCTHQALNKYFLKNAGLFILKKFSFWGIAYHLGYLCQMYNELRFYDFYQFSEIQISIFFFSFLTLKSKLMVCSVPVSR